MMFLGRRVTYCLLSFTRVALSVFHFQHPDDLPDVDYDFIIVGGGNAGAVVAGRLGENQNFKVLVIEAGPSNDDVFETSVPGLTNKIGFGTRVDWNFSTVSQPHANGQVFTYGRAKILGGCSSHNGLAYTRGSRDDYDRWASVTGDDSLSWDRMFPYILKSEKWSGPNDPNLPEEGHFDPSFHSFGGKIGVTAPYYLHPFNDLLFEATKELSDEFPFLFDLNGGKPIGLGWVQRTTIKGVRSSSATGYLSHAGNNVHILLNTYVTRILPTGSHGKGNDRNAHGNDFRKVEFATASEGPRQTLTAKKELILSAGVINSPQVLLSSGIGPKDELGALGIRTLVDNPSVGKNFSDQTSVLIHFATNLPVTDFDETTALAEWNRSHTGRLALSTHLSPIGWVRFPATANPLKAGSDPTGGPNSPHVELVFEFVTPQNASTGMGGKGNASISVTVVGLTPASRGSITLSTSSPFDPPAIDPNLLGSPLDTAILVEGIRSARRLFSSSSFSKNIFGSIAPEPNSNGQLTDDIIAAYIKAEILPFLHGVGSCSMAPRGATWGVVDPEFRVRGVRGLRVVDASVIPIVTSGHTQAPIYAIAERASDVIIQEWR